VERSVDLLKSQFDIDREPFSDAGISGLFYPGAGRQQALEQLLHLVRYGPPLLLVVGDEGSGKTLLSHQLNRQLDSSIFSCVSIEATVLMNDRELMALICEGFNLQVELTKDNVVSALVRFSAESESYSQTALVVIDGVQNLSEAAAEFLAEIATLVKDGGLRFLLLVDTVDIRQEGALTSLVELIDSLGQSLQLPALDVSEVADYLSYRMRTAGLDGVRFSPQQVKQITGESEGVIARINQFARETLVHQVPVIAKEKRRPIISSWHLVVVVVLSVGIGLLMLGEQGQDTLGDVETSRVVGVVTIPGDDVPASVGKVGVEVNAAPSHQQPKKGGAESYVESGEVVVASGEESTLVDLNYAKNEVSVENSFAKDEEPKKKLGIDKIKAQESGVGDPAENRAINKALLTDVQIELPIKGEVEKMEWDNSINVKPGKVVSDTPVLTKVASIKAVSIKAQAPALVTNKESTSVSQKTTEKSEKQNKKPRLNDYTLREKWLLSLDPKQYTLQMIGARDEGAVQEFISHYPSLTKVAYYKTLFKGSDWYVVIYGQFSSKNEAKLAVTRLPKNLIASKPWTRPLASVQKDIRMARL